MDRKLLLASAVSALVGFGLLRLYLFRFEREATGGPKTAVLYLTKDVPAGALLARDFLAQRGLPQAYLESRHVAARDLDQVIGTRLTLAGRAGEALLYTDLASTREPARQLSTLIAEGKRAFTLSARSTAFDALLTAGDRVDVLLTRAERGSLVVQNVLVLAVGGQLPEESSGASRSARPDQVSLSLTPIESVRVAEAEREGPLRLIVRNPDDLGTTDLATAPPASLGAPADSAGSGP